jgi:hypothetical protein
MRSMVKTFPILMALAMVSCICSQVPVPNTSATATPLPLTPTPGAVFTPIPSTTGISGGPAATVSTSTPKSPAKPFFQGTPRAVGAPGQVKAEPLDTGISLQWPPVPGALGYLIYRDGNPEPLNLTPTQYTKYEDIGLTTGRTYTYTVAAVDAASQVIWRSAELAAAAGGR